MITKRRIHEIESHIGHKVRSLRIALGMTQKELASKLGISFQQLQKNEKGENKISCGRLYLLSIVLKVDVNYFFEDINHMYSDEIVMSDQNLESDQKFSFSDHISDNITYGSALSKNGIQVSLDNKEVLKVVKYYNKLQNSDLRKAIVAFLKLCKSCN